MIGSKLDCVHQLECEAHPLGKMVLPIIAIFATCLGGLLALSLARTGTCTMGDAGQLGSIVLAMPFYAVTTFCTIFSKSHRAITTICVAVLPVLLWQTAFALNLMVRIWVFGSSACEVLTGLPYEHDGNETFYVALWLLVSLSLPIVFAIRLRQSRLDVAALSGSKP